tara:strand:- start:2086 stop:2688 length:603 start_codon:yes stop_codon:yes gene_type:complete
MRARMVIKLANIKCEIREVRLNNKPDHMLAVSPKGTVPILIIDNKVIDESNDIIKWVMDQQDIFDTNLSNEQNNLTDTLIKKFDDKFKFHLDRYKYATRYEDINFEVHRAKCLQILVELDKVISDDKWIFGYKLNKLDISILPFIRQFRIADTKWFDSQIEIKKVKRLLNNFLLSKLFIDIMHNYEVWNAKSKTAYFPFT